ncbi:MAG: Crp/Fnr family transcriptional regulator [Burkholderiales bacterium]
MHFPNTLRHKSRPAPLPPTANHLLANVPVAEYQRLAPHLEPVTLPSGWPIHEVSVNLKYALFPTDGIFSRLHVMEDGASAAFALTGNEGLVGISLLMGGGGVTTSRAIVQSAGHAYRLRADILMQEFQRGGHFRYLLLRHSLALINQIAQFIVCYRHHSLEQNFCRWMLMSLDRLPGNEIAMTQELIANTLGVRREGVTEAAGRLQRDGLIHYRRGHITILNRPALEQRVCECYGVLKKEYSHLL